MTEKKTLKTCANCGKLIPKSPSNRPRKYCKRSCRQRAYESRKYNIHGLWKTLAEYEFCYLCGELLDWAAPQSICTDHMIATVYGGRTVPENVRPVHIVCNLKKGSTLIAPLSFDRQ
ncbi:HNH endonuclease [uncultured Corynebacterium sp.]|uniref:HNH endonuclease n=1 Tax=uncultured Corynebacterium sp. TaxID=159447 RepID=UPI00345AADD4